jgi:hypothetical protein
MGYDVKFPDEAWEKSRLVPVGIILLRNNISLTGSQFRSISFSQRLVTFRYLEDWRIPSLLRSLGKKNRS